MRERRLMLGTVCRPRLSAGIVEELAAQIIAGDLAPGTTLPTEPQLGDTFCVSRTVIREAMAQLARSGLVQIRQGSGTVVLPPDQWHELDPDLVRIRAARGLIGDLIPDLLAIRRLIEIEAAGQAALQRDEDDLASLSGLIQDMEAHLTAPRQYNDADIAFHNALIAASGNNLLCQMMRPINELRRIGSVITSSRVHSIVLASMAGHRELFGAVARQDPAGSRAAMAHHIAQFERDMIAAFGGGLGQPSRPPAMSPIIHNQTKNGSAPRELAPPCGRRGEP